MGSRASSLRTQGLLFLLFCPSSFSLANIIKLTLSSACAHPNYDLAATVPGTTGTKAMSSGLKENLSFYIIVFKSKETTPKSPQADSQPLLLGQNYVKNLGKPPWQEKKQSMGL